MATLAELLQNAAAYAPQNNQPTAIPPQMPPSSGVAGKMYGPPAPQFGLPSWLPPNAQPLTMATPSLPPSLPPDVRNYILTHPSYSEGGPQGTWGVQGQGEPTQPLNPQIDDIHRLFGNRIQQNAPSSVPSGLTAPQLRALMQAPGFSGFTGGVDI